LDTGAEVTLLDRALIERLDVHIKSSDYDIIKGVSGEESQALFGTVDIELANSRRTVVHRWSARVGFMKRPEGAILGYEGFLDHFLASFHGPLRHVTLSLRGTPPVPCMPDDGR
jgi:hypothetical protein